MRGVTAPVHRITWATVGRMTLDGEQLIVERERGGSFGLPFAVTAPTDSDLDEVQELATAHFGDDALLFGRGQDRRRFFDVRRPVIEVSR